VHEVIRSLTVTASFMWNSHLKNSVNVCQSNVTASSVLHKSLLRMSSRVFVESNSKVNDKDSKYKDADNSESFDGSYEKSFDSEGCL
jgi:hypothetical protein